MKSGNELLYEELLDYCENNYEIMEKTLIYLMNRLKQEKEGAKNDKSN